MYAPNVQGAVLALEGSYTAHVVAVVGVLVAPEAVDVAGKNVRHRGQAVEVFAIYSFRTGAAREEETEVRAGRLVGLCVAAVSGYVAATLRGSLGEVFVFAVTTRPFVVPDIVDCACLWGLLSLYLRWVDLGTCRSSFAPDDLLDFLAFGICCDDSLFGRVDEFVRCG